MEKKILAIIQARLGSTRLPKKVLIPILGKPILWHIKERLKYSKLINEIVFATTTNKEDDLIEEFGKNEGLKVYRGSQNDVLDRFYQCAKEFSGDYIVRIWGDCPLIDPTIVDKMISTLIEKQADYVSNLRPPTFHRGISAEVFTFRALEKTWNETNTVFFREYMTDYIFRNPNKFKIENLYNTEDMSNICLSVDYEKDLFAVTEIFKKLQISNKIFLLPDILNVLDERPELKQNNTNLPRYSDYLKELKKQNYDPIGWKG